MDELFAPWRIEWVKREDPAARAECPFCELPGRDDDRETLILARSEHAYLLLNNSPYNPGHTMVIPRRHVTAYDELTDDELLDQGRLTQRAITAMEVAMGPDGFNTGCNLGGASGGSIDHVHRHIVPRWAGDTNFMAIVGETKVIVQALAETYDLLQEALAEQDDATAGDRGVAFAFD